MSRIPVIFCASILIMLMGCRRLIPLSPPVEWDYTPIPTPASFDTALDFMRSDVPDRQIAGMWAALDYRDSTAITIPLVIANLADSVADVRSGAARVLGEFGPIANQAVPYLINVIQSDASIQVRTEAARALGRISNQDAVPALARNLYEYEDVGLAIYSAKAISMITHLTFPDSNSGGGYRLNEQGVPLIVVAAQEWWENTGQYLDW